jgi:hypothetical protein
MKLELVWEKFSPPVATGTVDISERGRKGPAARGTFLIIDRRSKAGISLHKSMDDYSESGPQEKEIEIRVLLG